MAFEQIKIKPFFNKKKKLSYKALSKETKKVVVNIYKSDHISRQVPGKRDVVATRDEQVKQKLQKQPLTIAVLEVFSNGRTHKKKIGKSSFAALRAPDKLLTSELPRNVFVRKYHENLICLLECLHQFDERFP